MHLLTSVHIQGGPINTVRHASHNMWMHYKLVSVDEVSSEKNDSKISNFGSVVLFSMAHFVRQCRGPKFSIFSNECQFVLPQLQAVIYLTLSVCIVMSGFLVQRMHIDEVNLVTAQNYGEPKWHSFMHSLS